jgi:hypothetical protein
MIRRAAGREVRMTERDVRLRARRRDSVSWVWRLEGADGTPSQALPSPTHPSQSDAESWLGETWRELAAAGIAQVTLFEDGTLVYGPMPLTEG